MFSFFKDFFTTAIASSETYVVTARRYTIPPFGGAAFSNFEVQARSEYEAARYFDQEYSAWTRLCVTKKPTY